MTAALDLILQFLSVYYPCVAFVMSGLPDIVVLSPDSYGKLPKKKCMR